MTNEHRVDPLVQRRLHQHGDWRRVAWHLAGYVRLRDLDLFRQVFPAAPSGVLVEIGAGEGSNLILLDQLFPAAGLRVASDYSPAKCRLARRLAPQRAVVCAEAARLPFRDGAVGTLLMRDLLHHVPDPAAAIDEALRLLAGTGMLIIMEGSCRNLINKLFVRLFPAERGMRTCAAAVQRTLAARAVNAESGYLAAGNLFMGIFYHRFFWQRLQQWSFLARALLATDRILWRWSSQTRGAYHYWRVRRPAAVPGGTGRTDL